MIWHKWILTAKRRILMEIDILVAWPNELTLQPSGSREKNKMTWASVANCAFRTYGNSQGTGISSLTGNPASELPGDEGQDYIVQKEYDFEHEPIMDILEDNYESTGNDFGFDKIESFDKIAAEAATTRQETDIAKDSTSDIVFEGRPIIDVVEDLNKVRRCKTRTDVDASHAMN
jgi:hypothetical protein